MEGGLEMRTLIVLVCGVIVLVAVFLPWYKGAVSIGDGLTLPPTPSGWDMMEVNAAPLLVLACGILMIVWAVLALILPALFKLGQGALLSVGIAARAIAVVAIIGAIWYIADTMQSVRSEGLTTGIQTIGYGVFIAIVAAGFGLAFGGVSPGFLVSKKSAGDISATVAEGRAKPETFSRRQYLESKSGGAVGAAPSASKEHFNRASQYEAAGEYEKAIEEYTQAVANDSKYALAYFSRGSLLMTQGKKAEAIKDFKKVIELAKSPELARMAEKRIAELG
jgi:tetratricopeptide (TPR) repeat protein